MKTAAFVVILLFATGPGRASEFQFLLNPSDGIFLATTTSKESVQIFRRGEKTKGTLFKLRLRPTGAGTYATSRGLIFKLDHLSKPVINDRNAHINSGNWELSLFGKTEELRRFEARVPLVAFGKKYPSPVYFGEKVQ